MFFHHLQDIFGLSKARVAGAEGVLKEGAKAGAVKEDIDISGFAVADKIESCLLYTSDAADEL